MSFLSIDRAMQQALRASKIRGVWPAIVVDNKDGPDNPGYRVKLKFPWLSDQETTFWARIAIPMAGPDRGYRIDPRDMRRGDLVGVDWAPTNGGHAVFVWDVHLDASGAVDCFTFLSSNGTSAGGGVGISVYTWAPLRFFNHDGGKYTRKLSPTFDDHPEYTRFGAWHALPPLLKKDIDTRTFNQPLSGGIIDASSYSAKWKGPEWVGSLRVIRFWGVAHNFKTETPLFGRIVYLQQLDGLALPTGEVHNGMCVVGDTGGMAPPGQQFDFFVGREDRHIQIPTLAASQGGSVCNVEILGPCAAYSRPQR